MGLPAGARLGVYEVIGPLGAGGMGEVYRARDTRLDRDVAIKILPEAFALDPERLARFEREAKTLAALNHPGIAQIHGIEPLAAAASGRVLVMELVDGEDLSARIARGALPLDEALPIARQIADALAAAHDRGIVHRDLKPANIRVRPDGAVKVLDFGLAKPVDPAEGSSPGLVNSPTFTSPALTAMGLILGTAAYMAPEQAKGRAVDRRADVWAFGVVLYEMLTGTHAFKGANVTEVLASVLKDAPSPEALPADTPTAIRRLLRRCLEKEPSRRLDSMAAAKFDIDDAISRPGEGTGVGAPPNTPRWRHVAPWLIATLAIVAAVAVGVPWRQPPAVPLRMSIAIPDGHRVTGGPAISRDGRQVVFASGTGTAEPRLYLRTLESFELKELPGTEGAERPFFSPDGRSIGFFARTKLFILQLEGGAPVALADAPSGGGGTWGEDGTIVFVPTWNAGLFRVSASGGTPQPLIRPDPASKEYAYVLPLFLPGGKEVLFSVWGTRFDIARLTLSGLEREVVVPGLWTGAVYARSGHLLVANDQGDVQAIAYPRAQGGSASTSVLGNVHWSGGEGNGVVKFAVSDAGTLVYAPGDIRQRSLVVVNDAGQAEPVPVRQGMYLGVNGSRDGRQAVAGQSGRIWLVDLERGTQTPLTSKEGTGAQSGPVWGRDGSRVFFASNTSGNWEIYAVDPDQPSTIETVLEKESDQFPTSTAADGALLFDEMTAGTGRDIWIRAADGTAKVWLATTVNEGFARFSPDGQYIAYQSDASGRDEIYAQSRDGRSARIQVSTKGGTEPEWAPSGGALFYREGNAMMAVDVRATPRLTVTQPRTLFNGGWTLPSGAAFTALGDGRRFLMVRFEPAATPTRLDVVFNWFDELRRRAPAGSR